MYDAPLDIRRVDRQFYLTGIGNVPRRRDRARRRRRGGRRDKPLRRQQRRDRRNPNDMFHRFPPLLVWG